MGIRAFCSLQLDPQTCLFIGNHNLKDSAILRNYYSFKLNKITLLFAGSSIICGLLPTPILQMYLSSLWKMRLKKRLENRLIELRKVLLGKVG